MVSLQDIAKRFSFLWLALLISACNSDASQSLTHNESPLETYTGSVLGQQFNDILLAEIYNQLGEPKLAVNHYQSLSKKTNDPELIGRATKIAAKTGQLKSGLEFANKWVKLSPKSLEARQYKALLQLRNKKFAKAADQLQSIRLNIEKNNQTEETDELFNKGLKFIGSMLSVEAHHEKAFTVFQLYLQKYGRENHLTQQNLILASLAMKAKKYEVVLSAFDDIQNAKTETIPEIVMMKSKALQNLKRIDDAVESLESYVENNEASDSVKLELVRLLILNKEKSSAGVYLKVLVSKHPENKDLLKSLIALEIDQSKLDFARVNIQRLMQSEDYRSDAEYFMGEVLEAEGDLKSALLSYEKVTMGKLLKRAKKKILVLNQRLKGENRVRVNYIKNNTTDNK